MLRFLPIYKERVWGGHKIQECLSRKLPDGCIGESWDIVDRPEDQSVVSRGSMAGLSLREIVERYSEEYLGPDYPKGKPFPVLVKWLDCRERLSLQVHPPAEVTPSLGGEPKTELWYIVEAEPQAALLAGLKPGVTRDQFQEALQRDAVEPLVQRMPVKSGDALFVRSGCVHAIDAGNFILEIQQNSDTTYRVFDWGRLGLDGKPRELHTEQSLQSIDFHATAPTLQQSKNKPHEQILADSSCFRVRKIIFNANHPRFSLSSGEQPRLLHVVSGRVEETNSGNSLSIGDNVFLSYSSNYTFEASQEAHMLITENFIKHL